MNRGYGQYCPLALAAELLGQRWMILVISRLIDGCTTFSEIHRGVPRISPSMLTQRLCELEEAGLLVREKQSNKNTYKYVLTEAGWDLEGLIMQMAIWGQHWGRDMNLEDLDPAFLAWSMHTRINTEAMPPGRTVMEFEFGGIKEGYHRFWLVVTDKGVDMCLKHPGFDVDLIVKADIKRFVEAWRGFRDLREEIYTGHVVLEGSREIKRQFPDWLLLSSLAPYRRKRPGWEQRLMDQQLDVPSP